MHTHKGISTQGSDGDEESQEGLHSEPETIDAWNLKGLNFPLSVNGERRRNAVTAAAVAAVTWTIVMRAPCHLRSVLCKGLALERKESELHRGLRGPRSFIPEVTMH
ncbi:hypothetical protein PAXINDRAFT_21938 [Paxillus involutus ATCC 200175]|uniref:Uncharacterized protein n=1 Tax=Paxillus involutus ATCC 200175 TaxID=664439 RepID=A0A0C9T945_PAXIN|nr:hypothetical protein PAXINDRAFT_21938 [Paxillus involutus ATCC 200175]